MGIRGLVISVMLLLVEADELQKSPLPSFTPHKLGLTFVPRTRNRNSDTIWGILGGICGGGTVLVVVIIWYCHRAQAARRRSEPEDNNTIDTDPVPPRGGLDQRTIEMFPTSTLTAQEGASSVDEDPTICSICHSGFKQGQVVRTLPCNHVHHADCIDTWLSSHATCPICRQEFL